MHVVALWIQTHRALVDATGIDALYGLAAWIVLACGRVSLCTAAFGALGAAAAGVWSSHHHASIATELVAGAAAAAVAGLAAGAVLGRLRAVPFAVATLALSMALIPLHRQLAAASPLKATTAVIYAVLGSCISASWLAMRSRAGAAVRAVASDEALAATSGTDPVLVRTIALGASALVAGLAEVLSIGRLPYPGFDRSVDALAVAVIGGTSTAFGPLLGAGALSAVSLVGDLSAFRNVLAFTALLACALFAPGGIASIRKVWDARWRSSGARA